MQNNEWSHNEMVRNNGESNSKCHSCETKGRSTSTQREDSTEYNGHILLFVHLSLIMPKMQSQFVTFLSQGESQQCQLVGKSTMQTRSNLLVCKTHLLNHKNTSRPGIFRMRFNSKATTFCIWRLLSSTLAPFIYTSASSKRLSKFIPLL